jgi:adenylosuccinate synthase
MAKLIVLLSGSVVSGKSMLASLLEQRFGFLVVKTWQLLKTVKPDVPQDRESLQALGEELDKKTGGQWVVEELDKVVRTKPDALIVVDAVRIQGQIDFVRRGFGSSVRHIHLEAPTETLSKRYKTRTGKPIKELDSYEDVLKNETERDVPKLAGTADIVVDTNRNTPEDVLVRAACHLGMYGRGYNRVVDVLVGGQYGSEGKGQVAAYLAPEYDVLVRVGGPNAGHSVFEQPDPVVFHSLPSGTQRARNAQIVIGAGAVVNVETLWREINDCQLDHKRLTIDPQVMTISEADIEREKANFAGIGRASAHSGQSGWTCALVD